jgi:hypothetical protein
MKLPEQSHSGGRTHLSALKHCSYVVSENEGCSRAGSGSQRFMPTWEIFSEEFESAFII